MKQFETKSRRYELNSKTNAQFCHWWRHWSARQCTEPVALVGTQPPGGWTRNMPVLYGFSVNNINSQQCQ